MYSSRGLAVARNIEWLSFLLHGPRCIFYTSPRFHWYEQQLAHSGTRQFSTGNWWVLTNGKLYEKRKRKAEARQKRALDKESQKATGKRKLSVAELKRIKGNPRLAKKWGPFEVPRFYNVQRNRFGRICEPTCEYRLVITASKNNVWIVAQAVRNRPGEEGTVWRDVRTLFRTHAGNVGIRKRFQKQDSAAHQIGKAFGRKCKEFGIEWVDIVFREATRVMTVLEALRLNLKIKSITHIPRLPKGSPPPRKKRRRL